VHSKVIYVYYSFQINYFFLLGEQIARKRSWAKKIDREKWLGLFWLNFEAFSAAVMG
jgi:hypothetical protein